MKSKLLALVILTLLGTSCIDQLPLDIKESDNEYLIIDAELRDSETSHLINIAINSEEATDFQANFPVNDAEVYVLVDGNERIPFESVDEKGNYGANFILEKNRSYVLFINYRDITYKSSEEFLLDAIPAGEFRTIMSDELVNNNAGNVVVSDNINLLTDINFTSDDPVYLRYRIKGTYEYREIGTQGNLNPLICFVQEDIDFNNLALASNEDAVNGELLNKLIYSKSIDYRFSINYCLHVSQERISRRAYDFWSLVENEFNRTGDIFEAPPGIIRGNISEQEETDVSAIGLFSVIAVDKKDHHVLPVEAGNPPPQCQPFPPPPANCTNCLLIANSSLNRPECF